jgi:hypothetical protein
MFGISGSEHIKNKIKKGEEFGVEPKLTKSQINNLIGRLIILFNSYLDYFSDDSKEGVGKKASIQKEADEILEMLEPCKDEYAVSPYKSFFASTRIKVKQAA